jgi:phosphoglycerate dehydrogenase-like enzyme
MPVLLHPLRPAGVRGPLSRLPGISLEAPADEPGFLRAVEQLQPSVLITTYWRPGYWNPHLRWVAAIGAGYDSFPTTEFAEADIVLTNAKGLTASAVAEHAFALLLSLVRGIPEMLDAVPSRSWAIVTPEIELNGSTLAVLGLGEIGERIARIGAAFGMTVVGVKRDPGRYDGVASRVYGPNEIAEAVRGADVVVNALPGGRELASIVTGDMFEAMRGAYFVNIGRGTTVDEGALTRALLSGTLRGAGLDVFASEPLAAESPLWAMDHVVISPHVGGSTPHYGRRWVALFVRNLSAFEGRSEWENRVV